jgi:hypothetical protein
MAEATVEVLFGLEKIRNIFALKNTKVLGPDPTLLYGVELEIESASFDDATTGWTATEDGSLRNHGVEFISFPMLYGDLDVCLSKLIATNGYTKANYSERCSVHVHANCHDFTLTQLAALVLMYQVFEGVLFTWIDSNPDQPYCRRENIFCVPISETQVNYTVVNRFSKGITNGLRQWHKYTALNLLPISTIGTVEFRHMGGECDIDRIMTWCRIIGHLMYAARTIPFVEVQRLFTELNTTSDYEYVMRLVFRDDAKCLQVPGYFTELENGVLNMKYSMLEHPPQQFFDRSTARITEQMLEAAMARQQRAPLVARQPTAADMFDAPPPPPDWDFEDGPEREPGNWQWDLANHVQVAPTVARVGDGEAVDPAIRPARPQGAF